MNEQAYFTAAQAGDKIAELTRKYKSESLELGQTAGLKVARTLTVDDAYVLVFDTGRYLAVQAVGWESSSVCTKDLDLSDMILAGLVSPEDVATIQECRRLITVYDQDSRARATLARLMKEQGEDFVRDMLEGRR